MKSAILIIDLQVGLFDEPGKPFDYENVVSKINALAGAARQNKIPVKHYPISKASVWK